MRQDSLSWRRGHSMLALIALMTVQVWLINHFRTGLVGSDDMTAAFTGKRLVTEFDMTVAFTNLPMSIADRHGVATRFAATVPADRYRAVGVSVVVRVAVGSAFLFHCAETTTDAAVCVSYSGNPRLHAGSDL